MIYVSRFAQESRFESYQLLSTHPNVKILVTWEIDEVVPRSLPPPPPPTTDQSWVTVRLPTDRLFLPVHETAPDLQPLFPQVFFDAAGYYRLNSL